MVIRFLPPGNAERATLALLSARSRYYSLAATERPGPQPENIRAAFRPDEIQALARVGYWPLPEEGVRFVTRRLRLILLAIEEG
jgi:hypothetical protein